MPDLAARYRALQALAQDQAGTPEGDSAARMAARLLEACPDLELPDVEPETRRLSFRHAFDRVLAVRIGTFLELEPRRVGRRRADGKGVRWKPLVELTGAPELLELAEAWYADHRQRLDQLLEWTSYGYTAGAFPLPERDGADDSEATPPPSLEALEAARAGMAAGSRHRAQGPIPEGRRLTSGAPQLEG